MFEHGQWATPVPVRAKSAIPGASSCTQCACHTSGPVQPSASAYSAGCPAVLLAAERDVVHALREVRVEPDAAAARQQRRFAHQGLGDAEGRAWRDADPHHRQSRRVVVGLDHAPGIPQDRVFILDQRVGRQPSPALAEAHRAAHGMEAQADLPRGVDRVVEPAAVRKRVQMIARGRAAREHQLGHRRQRRNADGIRRRAVPRSDRALSASRRARRPAPPGPTRVSVWNM